MFLEEFLKEVAFILRPRIWAIHHSYFVKILFHAFVWDLDMRVRDTFHNKLPCGEVPVEIQ